MIKSKEFKYDEIEIVTLPDPKCKLCWGTGKSTQRPSNGVPYRKPPKDLHPDEYKQLEEMEWAKTECDCIVKKNVIRAQKEKMELYKGD